uniref:Uncharacterized protein n=1 Tax=Setaria viridis TaxID=4556 RepID=A0A4U6VBQ6_SETVI|nr:hypothetical protein SEVIR_3G217880v2 [Setaria viridis]
MFHQFSRIMVSPLLEKALMLDIFTGNLDTTQTAMESSNLKAVGKQAPQRQDYRMFIPYWRSMLQSRLPVRMILAHALKSQHKPGTRRFHTAAGSSGNMSKDGRSLFLNCSLRLMGRAPQLRIHQSRRMYTTAALFF